MSAYFSGSLIEKYGVSFVFGVTALFPLLVVGAALLINEKRVSHPALTGSANGAGSGDGALLSSPLTADIAAQVRLQRCFTSACA